MTNKWTAFTRFLNAQKEYYDKCSEPQPGAIHTVVAKNGRSTEQSPRFLTFEEAEKKFIEYSRAGYKNVVITTQNPAADDERTAELKRLERRYHEAKALRYQPDES